MPKIKVHVTQWRPMHQKTVVARDHKDGLKKAQALGFNINFDSYMETALGKPHKNIVPSPLGNGFDILTITIEPD